MKRNTGVMTGLLCLVAGPAALSWATKTGFAPGQSMSPAAALIEAKESKGPEAIGPGWVDERQTPAKIEWMPIPGRKEGAIKAFEMSKTEVTVEQYAQCVAEGSCTKPGTRKYCNWGVKDRARHPVNCVDWFQANAYAKFAGARVPSVAEWEYAATSAGKNPKYPWGNEEPTCDKAVYDTSSTMPVCSKTAGNTAQGLCDMAGNVSEWTQDVYHEMTFEWSDGTARVTRGGGFIYDDVSYMLVDVGIYESPFIRYGFIGFRLARSAPSEAP